MTKTTWLPLTSCRASSGTKTAVRVCGPAMCALANMPGRSFDAGVGHGDAHGDGAVLRIEGVADHRYVAGKRCVGVCLGDDVGLGSVVNEGEILLVDRGDDPDGGEIGDGERFEAGVYDLADGDITRDHGSVDRGADGDQFTIVEVVGRERVRRDLQQFGQMFALHVYVCLGVREVLLRLRKHLVGVLLLLKGGGLDAEQVRITIDSLLSHSYGAALTIYGGERLHQGAYGFMHRVTVQLR